MLQFKPVLNAQLVKYDAIVISVEMSRYGYWQVTYSAAPGLYIPITVCETGITPNQARTLADASLEHLAGQKVRT